MKTVLVADVGVVNQLVLFYLPSLWLGQVLTEPNYRCYTFCYTYRSDQMQASGAVSAFGPGPCKCIAMH